MHTKIKAIQLHERNVEKEEFDKINYYKKKKKKTKGERNKEKEKHIANQTAGFKAKGTFPE